MELPKEEATRLFNYASDLYQEERFAEALTVLDDLMTYRQNSRRVLFARADCLYRLGDTDEAMRLCDELVANHDYEPAKKLRIKLEYKPLINLDNCAPAYNTFSLEDLDFDLPPTKIALPPHLNQKTDEEKKDALKSGIKVALLLMGMGAASYGLAVFSKVSDPFSNVSNLALAANFGIQMLSYSASLMVVMSFFRKPEGKTPQEKADYLLNASFAFSIIYFWMIVAYAAIPPIIAEVAGLFALNMLLIAVLRFKIAELLLFFLVLFIVRAASTLITLRDQTGLW